jgi:uncharacterized protein YbaR (Trm112 family)
MISDDLLAILRCPLNPSQAKLLLESDRLRCEQCNLRFRIQDGFPILVVEEAELPSGCESADELPCQKAAK